MIEYIKIAWRNIWRNKRRTLITAASVFFAVLMSIMSRAFHLGAWDYMIDGILHSYSGYIQVHREGFWDEKTFDYTMPINDSLTSTIESVKDVKGTIPRLETFGLISTGLNTKGVIVNGVDPEKENAFSKLSDHLTKGEYLQMNDTAAMISEKLASFLKVTVGDTIVLIGQGYQGNSAAGKYYIKGIVKLPSLEFDNKMVYLPLPIAQELYSCPEMITSLIVDIKRPTKMDDIRNNIASALPAGFEVMTWHEMLEELHQQFIVDNSGGIIMLLVLYLIVGFGVFGTVLMMTSERTREFGIMIAVGMQKRFIQTMVGIEMFYVVLMGLISGMLVSIPFIIYYHFNPIQITGDTAKMYETYGMQAVMPVAWRADYIYWQGIIVFFIVIIAIAYPLWAIGKMKVTTALRK